MPGDWEDAINGFMDWLAASGASPQTIRLRRHYLRRLAQRCPAGPWVTTTDDLIRFLARNDWAPETRRSCRSAIKGLYRWASATGRLAVDPALSLPTVRVPPGVPRPTPEAVFARALETASPRDRLMLLLAGHAGLRRSEVAAAHSRDVLLDVIRVRGKGGRVRLVPLTPALAEALARVPPGYLFPGKVEGHLSAPHVGRILSKLLDGYSAHTCRHRFASRTFAGTRDLLVVARLLGHSRTETTQRYTQLPDGALAAAVMYAA